MTYKLTAFAATVAVSAMTLSATALAGSFALTTQSLSSRSMANAGAGVQANDATALYSNPAAMSKIKAPSVSVGLAMVKPTTEISNASATVYSPMIYWKFVQLVVVVQVTKKCILHGIYRKSLRPFLQSGVYAPFFLKVEGGVGFNLL